VKGYIQQLVLLEPIAPKMAILGVEAAIRNGKPTWLLRWLRALRMMQQLTYD
jgi:hypothetical protein